jgi:hypothetical protein
MLISDNAYAPLHRNFCLFWLCEGAAPSPNNFLREGTAPSRSYFERNASKSKKASKNVFYKI